jgi:hypothetical protein
MRDTIVCTITREGTDEMNDMSAQTIRRLQEYQYTIAAVHIKNKKKALSGDIKQSSKVSIISPSPKALNPIRHARKVSESLLGGLREIISRVSDNKTRAIVYMEGDKCTFVPSISTLIEPILQSSADLTIAARSPEGFSQFPWVQQLVERSINRYISKRTGIHTDYLYGPRAFSPRIVSFFGAYKKNDWGVIMYPLISAIAKGYRFEPVTIPGYPQPHYMKKYDMIMRSPPAHFAWRSIQNIAIVRATRSALVETGSGNQSSVPP